MSQGGSQSKTRWSLASITKQILQKFLDQLNILRQADNQLNCENE